MFVFFLNLAKRCLIHGLSVIVSACIFCHHSEEDEKNGESKTKNNEKLEFGHFVCVKAPFFFCSLKKSLLNLLL